VAALVAAAKAGMDAASGIFLFLEQLTGHRTVCSWCAPELDSAPVCWSLLDPGGGHAAFRDVRYVRCSAEPADHR
jgi:hypothetical protein